MFDAIRILTTSQSRNICRAGLIDNQLNGLTTLHASVFKGTVRNIGFIMEISAARAMQIGRFQVMQRCLFTAFRTDIVFLRLTEANALYLAAILALGKDKTFIGSIIPHRNAPPYRQTFWIRGCCAVPALHGLGDGSLQTIYEQAQDQELPTARM